MPEDADPCATAARELREETGYAATRLRRVGVASGPTRRTTPTASMSCWRKAAAPAGAHMTAKPARSMETLTMPVAEAIAGVTRGLFVHAMHLGGLLLALHAAGRLRF